MVPVASRRAQAALLGSHLVAVGAGSAEIENGSASRLHTTGVEVWAGKCTYHVVMVAVLAVLEAIDAQDAGGVDLASLALNIGNKCASHMITREQLA